MCIASISRAQIPVILCGDYIGAFGVLRSLGCRSIPVYVVSPNGNGLATRSRHVRSVLIAPPTDSSFIENLTGWIRKQGIECAILMVADDDEYLDVLAKNLDALPASILPTFPDWQRVQLLRDKWQTHQRAESLGISVPRTSFIKSSDDLQNYLDQYSSDNNYPVLLKMARSRRFFRRYNKKGVICQTRQEVINAYSTYDGFSGELLIQELIPGGEEQLLNMLVVSNREGVPLKVFINKKRRSLERLGNCTIMQSTWSEEVLRLGLHLVSGLGYYGYANPEFKLDLRDGQLKLMEVNGRITLSNSHALRCGIDLIGQMYDEALAGPLKPPEHFIQTYPNNVLWWSPLVDLYGLLLATRRGEVEPWKWIRALSGKGYTIEPFSLRDPWPGIYYVGKTIVTGMLKDRFSSATR